MVLLDMDNNRESNASSTATDNILSGMNGGTTGGRSVSNTLRDHFRLTSTSAPLVNGGSTTVGRHQHSHQSQSTRISASSTSSRCHHHHHNSPRRVDGERISSTSSSTSTAKESFLNYFFGQNGPGPVAGANITNMPSEVHDHLNWIGGAVGRDISGPDPIANTFVWPTNEPTRDRSDSILDTKLGKTYQSRDTMYTLFGNKNTLFSRRKEFIALGFLPPRPEYLLPYPEQTLLQIHPAVFVPPI